MNSWQSDISCTNTVKVTAVLVYQKQSAFLGSNDDTTGDSQFFFCSSLHVSTEEEKARGISYHPITMSHALGQTAIPSSPLSHDVTIGHIHFPLNLPRLLQSRPKGATTVKQRQHDVSRKGWPNCTAQKNTSQCLANEWKQTRILVFSYITLCHWMRGSRRFERTSWPLKNWHRDVGNRSPSDATITGHSVMTLWTCSHTAWLPTPTVTKLGYFRHQVQYKNYEMYPN